MSGASFAQSLNAQSLGIFPASEIFVTQTYEHTYLYVIHIKKVDGRKETTILSREASVGGNLKSKFLALSDLVTSAKEHNQMLEVQQQRGEYFWNEDPFWIDALPAGTTARVSHNKRPYHFPSSEPNGEDSAHADAHYYHYYMEPIAGAAWDQWRAQEERALSQN